MYHERPPVGIALDFRTATDLLGLSATDLAEAFGLQPQTIRQMRLALVATSYRTPPAGWQKVIIRLARERGRELDRLVAEFEGATAPMILEFFGFSESPLPLKLCR